MMSPRNKPTCNVLCVLLAVLLASTPVGAEAPFFHSQPIVPAEPRHNHASCLIEGTQGHFLAACYSGRVERKADDVVIQGAWLVPGRDRWDPRFQGVHGVRPTFNRD
jgi:hypothetical protein